MNRIIQRLAMAVAMIVTALTAFADKPYGIEIDGIIYHVLSHEDKTVAVIYVGDMANVVIPETIPWKNTEYTVTSIDSWVTRDDNSVISIFIPQTVTTIIQNDLSGIFRYTSLTNLAVDKNNPNYHTEDNVLYNKDKTELLNCVSRKEGSFTIPQTVTKVSDRAFWKCKSLTDITIPNSITSIGESAFAGCSSLTSIVIPNSVTTIESGTFSGCSSLTSIAIPNSVTTIESYSFSGCSSLTSIAIPNSVTQICSNSFLGCSSLTDITIPNTVTDIGPNAFKRCSSLTNIDIPSSVLFIRDESFGNCSSLTSIEIPETVRYIGNYAFNDCSSLKTADIGAKKIERGAFNNCHSLTSITIRPNVSTIDNYAFSHCSSLSSVLIPETVDYIGSNIFKECNSLTTAEINAKNIGETAFQDCTSLSSVKLGEGVKSISKYAFAGCSSLTSIKTPNSVTEIGLYAFTLCSSLKSVSFGSSYNMTDNPFAFCSSLTEMTVSENNPYICAEENVIYSKDKTELRCYPQGRKGSFDIPDYVTTISEYAFRTCSFITSVRIPDSVTSIEDYAFKDCESLSQICIGSNVDQIGYGAFYNPSLKTIYCTSKFPPIIFFDQNNDDIFDTFCDETYKFAKLYVPAGRGAKYEEADGWKNFRKIDEMDAGVEEAVGEDMTIRVVNGSIVIDGVEDGCTIEVYDMTGKAVYSGAGADIPNMPRGIYVVRIGGKTVKVAV